VVSRPATRCVTHAPEQGAHSRSPGPPASAAERVAGGPAGDEGPEEVGDGGGIAVSQRAVDELVELRLDVSHTFCRSSSVVGEREFDVAPVVLCDVSPDQARGDQAIDQSAGVGAALADEQLAESGQGQRLSLVEQPEDLRL